MGLKGGYPAGGKQGVLPSGSRDNISSRLRGQARGQKTARVSKWEAATMEKREKTRLSARLR